MTLKSLVKAGLKLIIKVYALHEMRGSYYQFVIYFAIFNSPPQYLYGDDILWSNYDLRSALCSSFPYANTNRTYFWNANQIYMCQYSDP